MSINDELGSRLKHNYEEVSKTRLIRRMPVMIRIDGKAFHTFTKGMVKPFDSILVKTMQDTMKYLCENIQGCVLGYTQSDEITLILQDYKELDTAAWFDYEVQKVCSISASLSTLAFNKAFYNNANKWMNEQNNLSLEERINETDGQRKSICSLMNVYDKAIEKGAMFDSRCFNVPKEEVTNFVYWRQIDAERNSIQSLGQANFSHKQLNKLSCRDIKSKLETDLGIVWGNLPTHLKRGSCCIRDSEGHWFIDMDIPRFKDEGREYIESRIDFTKED